MSFKTTCHWLVCSSLHESLMNATIIIVEYRYNYYYVSSLVYFYIIYYIENATVKRVHACYYYPKGEIFQTDIYITCHCRLCFEKFNWLPICEMWSFILFTIWWQFGRCLHFFRIIIMRFHYINRQLYRSLKNNI